MKEVNMVINEKIFDRLKNNNELKNADEQLLLLKIVDSYIKEGKIPMLYKILTKKDKDTDINLGIEVQPLTHRYKEGNTYLDLAMGDIIQRGETVSGIELNKENRQKNFVFCEAKWKSDLSIGVSKCSIRNQLQRVVENALLFADEDFEGNIFVTLITPKMYKNHYELGINTRFYSYKYKEYEKNMRGTFLKELDLIKDLNTISFKNERKSMDIIEKNLDKLVLNWVTFEELIEGISNEEVKMEIVAEYDCFNEEKI